MLRRWPLTKTLLPLPRGLYANFAAKRGFTLIEVLIVLVLISVLASMALANTGTARVKARDFERKTEIQSLRRGLELYYSDNETFPIATEWVFSLDGCQWIAGIDQYFDTECLPTDPRNNAIWPWDISNENYSYAYRSDSTGQSYDLVAQLERADDPDTADKRCWLFHTFNNAEPGSERPWSSICTNGHDYSSRLFADH